MEGVTATYARLVRNLDSLLEVSKAMAAAIDLDPLLGIIQSKATEVMEAERGSIFVHDEGTGTLWNRVSGGLAPGVVRAAVGFRGQHAAQQMFAHVRPGDQPKQRHRRTSP